MYEKLLNKYAINQLGYVVDDLEKAALAHSKLFGSGPFVHFTPPAPERTLFRGEEVKNTMEVAYGMYGDLQIELIKPTSSDPTPYTVPSGRGSTTSPSGSTISTPPSRILRRRDSRWPCSWNRAVG